MKTVDLIFNSKSENKIKEYVDIANELTIKAYQLVGNSSFLSRFVIDMENICESIKTRDNEYMIYRDALAAEIIYSKLEGIKSGKLSMRDLIS